MHDRWSPWSSKEMLAEDTFMLTYGDGLSNVDALVGKRGAKMVVTGASGARFGELILMIVL